MSYRSVAVVSAALALGLAPAAEAQTFQVTSGAADGPGSLREAIANANAQPDSDAIVFTAAHQVDLTGQPALPALQAPASIDGAGGRLKGGDLTLSGASVTRLGILAPNRIVSTDPPAPSGLKVFRAADNTLHVSGSLARGGAVDLLRDGGASWLGRLPSVASGPFDLALPFDVAAGGSLTGTLTDGGTSAFGDAASLADLTAPVATSAVTVDANGDGLVDAVRVATSEPLDDAFSGLTVTGVAPGTGSAGPNAGDASFDVAVAPQLTGDAQPQVAIAANTSLADAAGNRLLQSAPIQSTDAVAPRVLEAVGTARNAVKVSFTEPIQQRTFAPTDFTLSMAGTAQVVKAVKVAADGRSAELDSAGTWDYGSAGALKLNTAITDAAGNRADPVAATTRVWASPGDVTAPVVSALKMSPTTVCLKGVSHNCKHPGSTVGFTVDEPVSVMLEVRRKQSSAVSSIEQAKPAGSGTVKIGSKVEGRKLTPGRYTVTVTITDAAGNFPKPKTISFKVRK